MANRPLVVLTIAGSDSGGGAGIQADLKAFARCGVHGVCAITAITAQNTIAVEAIEPVSPSMIGAQIDAIVRDLPPDAIKIGMVGGAEAIGAVCEALDRLPRPVPVVLDPVMVAESGGRLLEPDAEAVLVESLLPKVTVVTPNIPEATVLAGVADRALQGVELCEAVLARGARSIVLTGGHSETVEDLVLSAPGATPVVIGGPRYPDGAAHGSGCTHSSVLAAQLARGLSLVEGARVARELAGEAVRDGLRELGAGAGPVHILGQQISTAQRVTL